MHFTCNYLSQQGAELTGFELADTMYRYLLIVNDCKNNSGKRVVLEVESKYSQSSTDKLCLRVAWPL